MTKTITLILVTLFTVACGGEPFSGAELDAAGGDGPVAVAGAPDAAGSHAAGSAGSSRGGATSGGSSSTAGAATAGAATGGTVSVPVACDLDTDQLTAALPASFVWSDYTYTNGDTCTTCRDSPCGNVDVISWGVPQTLPDGRLQYLPNTNMAGVPMNFGANDGTCTKQTECVLKGGSPSIILTVERDAAGWHVTHSEVQTALGGCAGAPANTIPMGYDLNREMDEALIGLEIPCN